MNLLSIEIGGSKLQLAIGTPSGNILECKRFIVDSEAGGSGIRQQIAEALPKLVARWNPAAIGVGYGGPVDWTTGTTKCSHQINGWDQFALGVWLHDQVNIPVFVDNDANVAALGEAVHGAGKGKNPVFWVNCGSGVGGGLVVDGQIYHGALPGEMEIGHIQLNKEGNIVEDHCSGWAVDRAIRRVIEKAPESMLAKMVVGLPLGGESRMLSPALAQGCPEADLVLTSAMDDLAFALGHVVQLVNPSVIIVGGGLSLIGEPLRHRLANALKRYVMPAFTVPQVALAKLGEDAVTIGGLTLAAVRLQRG